MSTNEQSMKDAIGNFLKGSQLSGKLAEQRLIDCWGKLMGQMILKHTKSIAVSNKKLFLHLDSAPLRQELFYGRQKLITMLNEEVGETVINEIVFR